MDWGTDQHRTCPSIPAEKSVVWSVEKVSAQTEFWCAMQSDYRNHVDSCVCVRVDKERVDEGSV